MRLPWDKLNLSLGRCGRVRCAPGWRLGPEWSNRLNDYDLWLVWAGHGTMWLSRGRTLQLRPGVCLWMRPDGQYRAEQQLADPLGVTYIHFDLHHAVRRTRPRRLPAEVHEIADISYIDGLLRRIVDLLQGDPANQTHDLTHARNTASQLLRGLLMDLDGGAGQRSPNGETGTAAHHRQLVMQVISHLHQRSTHDMPAVTELAATIGYSPDHLTRVFKSVTGQSLQSFIVQQRINRARQLLTESSLTVSQIADALGYQSVYFFSRQFKQKTGRSPTRYRRGDRLTHPPQ